VNGIAAYEAYGRGRGEPLVVLDFGTATTFDAISANGEYLGGVICPGIQISADALFQRAARLPRIDVRKPANVIGRTTVTSMQSGCSSAMWEWSRDWWTGCARNSGQRVLRGHRRLAEVIAPETHVVDAVDRDLTLQGLRIVWERNTGK